MDLISTKFKDARSVFSGTFAAQGCFGRHMGRFFSTRPPILVGSGIYSATLQLLRLSALSCIDVVVPSATAAPYYSRSKAR